MSKVYCIWQVCAGVATQRQVLPTNGHVVVRRDAVRDVLVWSRPTAAHPEGAQYQPRNAVGWSGEGCATASTPDLSAWDLHLRHVSVLEARAPRTTHLPPSLSNHTAVQSGALCWTVIISSLSCSTFSSWCEDLFSMRFVGPRSWCFWAYKKNECNGIGSPHNKQALRFVSWSILKIIML